jgi:ABC-type lipoprotein release transport system permease subunit
MLAIITTNLLRRPARTIFTAGGIAVGVAMIVALLSFTQGLRDTAAGFVHLGGSDLGVFQANVSDPTASILPASMVGRLAARDDVTRATPLLLIVEGVKADPAAVVFGAERAGFFTQSLVLVAGRHALSPGQEILVGDRLAVRLHLYPGGVLTVKGRPYRIAGIYHSGIFFEDSGAVLGIAQAQRETGRPGEETDVVVELAPSNTASRARR